MNPSEPQCLQQELKPSLLKTRAVLQAAGRIRVWRVRPEGFSVSEGLSYLHHARTKGLPGLTQSQRV